MATPVPLVTVQSMESPGRSQTRVRLPGVFTAPLRPDLVRFVHTLLAKNKRQAYGVSSNAGYQTSAASWGTGRAVSRIPRVPGGGTHRTGQGAFGNFCRGGGMFSPNKTWRRWHRHVNKTMKRHALASAIASTACPSLVMARGHRIDQVPELPLVVSDAFVQINKTRQAVEALQALGCKQDLLKVKASKKVRCGRGKTRNRRYTMKKGPLVIYHDKTAPVVRAFRNIPGVDLCHVDRLNLLRLAPGGSLGRLCIWSQSAFKQLQPLYGSVESNAKTSIKKGYHLMRPTMKNADLSRLINSDEIQSVLKATKKPGKRRRQHPNPLKNVAAKIRLNPAARRLQHLAKLKISKGSLRK